jgi:hypothetical protein
MNTLLTLAALAAVFPGVFFNPKVAQSNGDIEILFEF